MTIEIIRTGWSIEKCDLKKIENKGKNTFCSEVTHPEECSETCHFLPITEIESSLNVFTEVSEFSDKNICYFGKSSNLPPLVLKTRMLPQHRQHTYMREGIFKLSPIQASVIYPIAWIHLIHWIPVPFGENWSFAMIVCDEFCFYFFNLENLNISKLLVKVLDSSRQIKD